MSIQRLSFAEICWAALWREISSTPFAEPDPKRMVMIINGSAEAYEKSTGKTRVVPPPYAEVAAYFEKLGSKVDPDDFFDYYEMKDWEVGDTKRKMKSWQAACRIWHRREQRQSRPGLSAQRPGQASLFALQAQLKAVQDEMEAILYPGGSSLKSVPTGAKLERAQALAEQRRGIRAKIDAISLA